jgi:hypothetical protein
LVTRWQRGKAVAEINPKWSFALMTGGPLYGESRRTAAILCDAPVRAKQLAALAVACGCDIIAPDGGADILVAELSSDPERTMRNCSEIAGYLEQSDAEALVWVGVGQIDAAFAALPVERCHFLVDADDSLAVPLLIRVNRQAKMDQLHDRNRNGDYGKLHKISDELADFARTLARIAEQEEAATPSAVSDKPISFRAAPPGVFAPMEQPMPVEAGPKAPAIRELIKLRRLRDQHFPADLFADPGWDILLDLFAAKLEGKSVSVSSLCIAAAVPPTTALRWITTMTEHGALVRKQDPNDARRVFIELSPDSDERLRAYFADAAGRNGQVI